MPDIIVNAAAVSDRFPVGTFARPEAPLPHDAILAHVATLAELPAALRAAVAGLDDAQLDTPYRDGGWTVRQVVHHVADSHMHMTTRIRFALTESSPPIRAYDQDAWVSLPDAALPVEPSLRIIDGVHERLVALLRALPAEAFARTYQHPENGTQRLDGVVAMYAWHGRHHVAHVTALRARMGW
ncbi:MAG: putative metal-dependent hydrolase [Gemmatimonadaceae bacterium]|jgi:uncharacterized damage-inducible protein DinB|nr:putative metal-dependent hydrolase [Gemmatimonadaceae bacterium]